MRRFAIALTALALSLSGLVLNPAHADIPADGFYNCATGIDDGGSGSGYFAITNGAVPPEGGRSCNGDVVIPDGVTGFGKRAFRANLSLAYVTSINIPSSVTTIGEESFFNSRLTTITIPASVTTIGIKAFHNSSGTTLTTVIFAPGSQLTSIGAQAFLEASALTSITLPPSLLSIGNEAFRSTRALSSITIPANVTSIGDGAFFDSQGLTNVTFQSGSRLASIGSGAFRDTKALASITIPASVTTIGDGAFSNSAFFSLPEVRSLTSITVDPANLNFSSIDGVLFNKSATTLIQYPSKKSNTTYSIPATVTSIGKEAFGRATNLTSVTIPVSVTTIGDQAFRQTTALSSIIIPASITNIGVETFSGASALSEVRFLRDTAPTVGSGAFNGVASSAKAYINSGATGFNASGTPSRWNGLSVAFVYEGVAFNTNGGTAVATRDYLENITEPTAPARPGYTFVGWTATDGAATTVTFPYAPSGSSAITLYAKWTPSTYVVTYDSKGGPSVTSGSFTTGGSVAEPTAPTRSGYTFVGWTATDGGLTTVAFPYAPGVIAGITLYAKWTLNTYPVTFNSKGGTAVTGSTFTVLDNIAQPTAPAKSGYTFAGWTATDGGLTTVTFPYSPSETSGITLYAKWTANTNAVTFNSKGGTNVTSGSFITGGSVAEPTAPAKAGYTFAGWTSTDGGETTVTFPYSPGVVSGITLYGKWSLDTYAVTFNSKGGTTVTGSTFTVLDNIAQPTAPEKSGYTFAGWTATDGAATTVTFPYAPDVFAGITLYAKWTANTYDVTYYDSMDGTAIANGSFTTGGSVAQPTAPTRSGYTFVGWTVTDGGSVTVSFPYAPGVIEEITLYAKWNLIPVVNNPPPVINNPAPVVNNPAPVVNNPVPVVDDSAALAARTISVKKTFIPIALAKKVGVKVVSPKAKVTMTVAASTKKNCEVVAGKLKTLKPGNCVVTFTVQQPKPAKGKQPKATKTVKTLVVK